MRSIELLGVSGVGKTFLYKRLFETVKNQTYLSVRGACIKAASSLSIDFGFNGQYLYSLLLRSQLLAQKEYGLSRKLLLHPDAEWGPKQDYELSLSLLKKYLSTEGNHEVVNRRIENFKHCIRLHAALKENLVSEQTVLFDEGALHHHHGLERSIASAYSSNEIKKDKALNPYAVVFLELPFEKHMSRIIQRKKKGINTFTHGKLHGKALEICVERDIVAYREKIETLKMFDVPVLHMDADQEVNESLKQIDVFIKNLN